MLLLNTAAHTARQQVLLSKGAVAGLLMMQGSDTYLNFLSTTVSSTPKASTSCRKCNSSSGVAEQQYHNCLDLAAERQAHLGDEEAVTLIQRHVVQGLSRPDAATFKTSAEKEGRLSRRKGGA